MADALRELRVVAFREADQWIAQCVERDVCVQGVDLPQVHRRMTVALTQESKMSVDRGFEPLGNLNPAPEVFSIMFDEAEGASMIGDIDMRVAA